MQRSSRRIVHLGLMALGVLAMAAMGRPARADAPPEAQAVLAQERRWLHALIDGDATTLAALLPENFVHITYQGRIRYRADELAAVTKPKPFKQFLSEQTVDFTHNVAIVHGLNTISMNEKVVMELRYTDVYTKDGNAWKPMSAQETQVAAPPSGS